MFLHGYKLGCQVKQWREGEVGLRGELMAEIRMNFSLCNRNILAIFFLWRRFGRLKDVRREE